MRNSCLLWPIVALGQVVRFLLKSAGRLAFILFGFVLVMVGVMVSFTIVGACIGIPLILLGVSLILRGLF
jgi:hypothetical protein